MRPRADPFEGRSKFLVFLGAGTASSECRLRVPVYGFWAVQRRHYLEICGALISVLGFILEMRGVLLSL